MSFTRSPYKAVARFRYRLCHDTTGANSGPPLRLVEKHVLSGDDPVDLRVIGKFPDMSATIVAPSGAGEIRLDRCLPARRLEELVDRCEVFPSEAVGRREAQRLLRRRRHEHRDAQLACRVDREAQV